MTDIHLAQARRNLVDRKLWGRVPEKAILTGAWDTGQLVQGALQDLLKHPPEAADE
jgi:hypothetical protein